MQATLEYIRTALAGVYDGGELETVCRALCLELLDIPQADFWLKASLEPDPQRQARLDAALDRLKRGEPLQYVLGFTSFCGLTFSVGPGVLIPRPETAELVEWVRSACAGSSGSLLDVGCGSGCISVTLASELRNWKVQGWDISDTALETSVRNAKANGVDVRFERHDILSRSGKGCRFDVIVSNPPYVTCSERNGMERNVLEYEPELALFVPDDDPLLYYRAIADFGLDALTPGGRLFFEINPLFAVEMEDMLAGLGYCDIETRTDIFGKRRMMSALLK